MHSKIHKYVFVLCGSAEHIQKLNCSIQYLRKFSNKQIIVLTDLSRNKTTIHHDIVLDIETPKHLTDHQAAIYLKTGLPQFLDMNPNIEYCYLDTDVIALRQGVDQVFSLFVPPVTFAADHGKMNDFSPFAIHDPQKQQHLKRQEYLKEVIKKHQEIEKNIQKRNRIHEEKIKKITKEYQANLPDNIFEQEQYWASIQTLYFQTHYPKGPLNPLVHIHNYFLVSSGIFTMDILAKDARSTSMIRFLLKFPSGIIRQVLSVMLRLFLVLSSSKWRNRIRACLNANQHCTAFFKARGFNFDFPSKKWISQDGHPLFLPEYDFDFYMSQYGYHLNTEEGQWYSVDGDLIQQNYSHVLEVEIETGFHWNEKEQYWEDNGEIIMKPEAAKNLLPLKIKEKFGVEVKNPEWQHWNGGVFLFDYRAIPFFTTWHSWTIQIFRNPAWQTRDQGTLIATAWKYGLENHPLLPIEFNFIADYYQQNLEYKGQFNFYSKTKNQSILPCFLHIIHHFGDRSWLLWQDVEKLLKQN